MTTPEERERRRRYAADAHARAKDNPKPCSNECGRDAAPRRKLCYTCKTAKYRSGTGSEYRKSYDSEYRARIKLEVIQAYGGACSCCGETEPVFLTLDHVNGDGGAHRATLGRGRNMWLWARSHGYPDTLRVLCFNCNFAVHLGECPHTRH